MQDDLATNRGDAAEVREDLEVTGLRLDRHLQAGALVTTTIAPPPGARCATNERVELGRYTISAGEHIRYGQACPRRRAPRRRPSRGARPSLHHRARPDLHGRAIVADYLEQSARFAAAGSDLGVEMSVGPSLANAPRAGGSRRSRGCVVRPALGTRRPSIWEAARCSDLRGRQDGSAGWRSRGRVGGQTRRRPLGRHRPDGHCEGQTR